MSVEANKAELEQLIKEQAQELAAGEVQHPEPHAVLRFDHWGELLNSEGEVLSGTREAISKVAHDWHCSIHGHEFMVPAQPSWRARGIEFRCSECSRVNRRNYRATHRPWKREKYRLAAQEAARRYRERKRANS